MVGTFRLDENFDLSFRWDKNNESFELINCLLEMEAGEPGTKPEREKCTLREVKHMPAMVFDPDQAEQVVSLLSRNQLTNTQALELHCNFSNLPGQVSRKGAEILQVGDSVRFHVQGSQQGKYPRTAEIIVKLVETDQDVQIKMETELEMPTEDQRTGKLEVRPVRFSPALMKKATENIKASSDKIDNLRDELKRQQFKHRTVMEELANLDPLDRPPEMKKERDELQATVMRLTSLLSDLDAELKELKSLETDVKQLLNEISSKAHLQFELRLMIPDAVVGGISLVETEDRNQ